MKKRRPLSRGWTWLKCSCNITWHQLHWLYLIFIVPKNIIVSFVKTFQSFKTCEYYKLLFCISVSDRPLRICICGMIHLQSDHNANCTPIAGEVVTYTPLKSKCIMSSSKLTGWSSSLWKQEKENSLCAHPLTCAQKHVSAFVNRIPD